MKPAVSDKILRAVMKELEDDPTRCLGMGFGDRFSAFRGGSGSFKGKVLRASKPGEMQGKRASKRRSHIT
jgi:hypothetical protein